jgi:hypothetical protein
MWKLITCFWYTLYYYSFILIDFHQLHVLTDSDAMLY